MQVLVCGLRVGTCTKHWTALCGVPKIKWVLFLHKQRKNPDTAMFLFSSCVPTKTADCPSLLPFSLFEMRAYTYTSCILNIKLFWVDLHHLTSFLIVWNWQCWLCWDYKSCGCSVSFNMNPFCFINSVAVWLWMCVNLFSFFELTVWKHFQALQACETEDESWYIII